MKFSVGDKVLVKATGELALVLEVLSDKMLEIEIKGLSFPAFIEDLDFPYFDLFTKKTKKSAVIADVSMLKVEKAAFFSAQEKGFYLLLLPIIEGDWVDEKIVKFKCYFYHSFEGAVDFEYRLFVNHAQQFLFSSSLDHNRELYIHDIAFEDLSSNPIFRFTFHQTASDKSHSFQQFEYKLRSKKLSQLVHAFQLNKQGLISMKIFEYIFNDAPRSTEWDIEFKPQSFEVRRKNSAYEMLLEQLQDQIIDLHIEKIVANPEGLQSFEKLFLQIQHFEKALDVAIQQGFSKLTVIHGIGKGVLLEKINQLCTANPHIKKCVNNYDSRYGYGASHIYFR